MRRHCPRCDTQVEVERSLENGFVFIFCPFCGMGLGVGPATEAEVRELSAPQDAPAPSPPDPGGTLARVEVVKQRSHVGAVVEKAPQAADPRAEAPPPPPAPAPPAPTITGRLMRRVYVVEDSTLLRTVTRDLLVDRGLARDVIELPDGIAMVEAFARGVESGDKPDLIFLDVHMPELDGRDAAYAIRAIETVCGQKRTPIVFFSSVAFDEAFKVTLQELGGARYVRKADVDDRQLGERVAEVLARLLAAQ